MYFWIASYIIGPHRKLPGWVCFRVYLFASWLFFAIFLALDMTFIFLLRQKARLICYKPIAKNQLKKARYSNTQNMNVEFYTHNFKLAHKNWKIQK